MRSRRRDPTQSNPHGHRPAKMSSLNSARSRADLCVVSTPSNLTDRRASPMWAVGVAVAAVLALAGLASAYLYQHAASAPVGEGELFKQEATAARVEYDRLISRDVPPAEAVRMLRNDLEIEAVTAVDPTGTVRASSAPELLDAPIDPFLLSALDEERFSAIAVALPTSLSVDGIVEWPAGSVVYQVFEPSEVDRGGLVFSYDISELLARRSQDAALQPLTVQLTIAGLLLSALATALGFARSQAKRRIWEANREAELLATRSRDLERHNKELEAARRELERALALAEETNRVRSEFVLMINHELRTPLTSVVTGAELLLDQPEMSLPERVELIDHLVHDGRRLIELMSQMLTVARVENRSLDFTLSDVAAERVLDRLTDRGDWLEVDPAAPLTVHTDVDTLVQLINSLADNARSHGASNVRLTVGTELPFDPDLTVGERPDDPIFFFVTDDGPGIDHDFLPRAFEKFEKRGRTSGTGLGLYLARMMAEAIDGHLAVSTSSSGTTIAIGVPAGVGILQEVAG